MKYTLSILFTFLCTAAIAQQRADTTFHQPSFTPRYSGGNAPTVYIDEAHFNFHTAEGRYKPFARLLAKDGYRVVPFKEKFSEESLKGIELLVIANAMADSTNWELPTLSAFSGAEIKAINAWINNGGALFLIADHMPAAGAAASLAKTLGFGFINGYLYNYKTYDDVDVFRKEDGALLENPVTAGIDSVATFTGQAFIIPKNAQEILHVGEDFIIYLPSESGKINGSTTPKFYAGGLSQGATLEYGKGRVAVFGEAGMFTAQVTEDEEFKMGMNNVHAAQNYRLLLNIIHWLDEGKPNR